jgi:mannitol/fructose-specific phosphotransferase system IIA component (Ntr-type)
MRLTEYLRPERVTLDLPNGDTETVLEALVARLVQSGLVEDGKALVAALQQREAAHTTAMPDGVAIPHCTVDTLDEPALLVGVAPDGTAFGPPDLEPVGLFFLLLSPPERARQHIRLLARIVRLLRHPGTVERLLQASAPEALLAEIERLETQQV